MAQHDDNEFDVNDIDVQTDEALEGGDDFDETAEPMPRKKSGKLFNVVLIVLAIAGGGALFYFKFMGGKLPAGVPQVAQAPQDAGTVMPPAINTDGVPASDDPMAGLSNPANSLPGAPDAPPMPDAVTLPMEGQPSGDMLTAADNATLPLPASPFDGAAPAVTDNNMAGDTVTLPGMDGSDAANSPAAFGEAPAALGDVTPPAADMPTGIEAPVDTAALPAPVDTAAPAPADMQQGSAAALPVATEVPVAPVMDNSAAATTAAPVAAPVDTAAISALEERVMALESSLSGLQSSMVTKGDLSRLEDMIGRLEKAAAKSAAAPKKEAPREEPAAAKKPVAEKPMTLSADLSKPAAAKKASPALSTRWVLRSAKPGTAWLSENGSQELRTVSIGDTVPGLGKIQNISKNSTGKWVVLGSQGVVNQ